MKQGDISNFRIIRCLKDRELSCDQICQASGLSRRTVVAHLSKLTPKHVRVSLARDGRRKLYRLSGSIESEKLIELRGREKRQFARLDRLGLEPICVTRPRGRPTLRNPRAFKIRKYDQEAIKMHDDIWNLQTGTRYLGRKVAMEWPKEWMREQGDNKKPPRRKFEDGLETFRDEVEPRRLITFSIRGSKRERMQELIRQAKDRWKETLSARMRRERGTYLTPRKRVAK